MTDLDELIRETLSFDAATHDFSVDLAARSMADGRQIRHRRRVGQYIGSVLGAAFLVAGLLVTVRGVEHHDGHAIEPADGGTGLSVVNTNPSSPWWRWPRDRIFGEKPNAAFFRSSHSNVTTAEIYACGTMPDGTDFEMGQAKGDPPHAPSFTQGWGVPGFGEGAMQGPSVGAGAQYVAVESPTRAAHDDFSRAQWLILVAKPGMTSANFSADGRSWRPMTVEHGIAVIELSSQTVKAVSPSPGHPSPAWISLSDRNGVYSQAPAEIE